MITNDLYTGDSRHSHSATQKPAPKTPHRPAPNPPAFANSRSFAQTPASSRFQISDLLDLHYNPSENDENIGMPPYANLNHAAQADPGEHQFENDYQELDGHEETIPAGAPQVKFHVN